MRRRTENMSCPRARAVTPTKKGANFAQRLVSLVSEPVFISFQHMLSEPNVFNILGRTHYERWHSCFWGWLLDASGSHLVNDYTLIRFLFLLLDERCLKPSHHNKLGLWQVLPTIQFTEVEVTPNEYSSSEVGVRGVGRFDVYITARYTDGKGLNTRLNAIIELKIDSPPDAEQSRKYADWLLQNHPDDMNLLVYIAPKLSAHSSSTAQDGRWHCLDYQLLNDKLLLPLLDHPQLNSKVRPFIVQYMKNLKNRYKGIKMAITDEETRMAVILYEKYSDVFDSIYDALVATGKIEYTTSEIVPGRRRQSGRIAVKINGKVFCGDTLRHLMEKILRYLVDGGLVLKLALPWATSAQRFVITDAEPPRHPNGKDFFYPIRYRGYVMESHYSRERGIQVLAGLCHNLGVTFERIET
ncbi:MAG: hypothetical protein FJ288_05545 [Planctomycetes bacterium]|nr:hypothetical protein [Planctomycetota bacterium]